MIKTTSKKIIYSLFLFTYTFVHSQTLAEKMQIKQRIHAEGIVSKPLYVVIYDEHDDEDFLKKLIKKHRDQELANYRKYNLSYNAFIKKAVDEMLTMFPSITYVSYKESKKIRGKQRRKVNMITRGYSYNQVYNPSTRGYELVEPRTEQVKFDTTNINQKTAVRFKTLMPNIGISTFDSYYERYCSQLFFQEADIRSAVLNIKWKIEADLKK